MFKCNHFWTYHIGKDAKGGWSKGRGRGLGLWHTAGRLAAVCKLFGGQFSPASSASATAFLRHYLKMHTHVCKNTHPTT